MTHVRPLRLVCGVAAAVAFLSLIGSVPCLSQPPPAAASHLRLIRAALTAAYDQINAASSRRDIDRVMSYLAPDYDETDAEGVTWRRDQMRGLYQDWLSRIHSMQSRYVIQSVVLEDGVALVEIRVHTDGTGERRVLLVRVQGVFTNDAVVRDRWVRTLSGWRLKHRQTLSSQTHMQAQ